MIELPEFMTGAQIERAHRRARELQRASVVHGDRRARELCMKGMRMAEARDKRMLLFLEKAVEWLKFRNDEQVCRFQQEGYNGTSEYAEFAVWREAYLRAAEPRDRQDVQLRTFGWYYGAVAEALGE